VLAPNPDRPPPEPGRRPPPDARQVLVGLAALIGVILFVLAVATLAVWWWRWIVA
jgi:fatty acid desaturase